jgi:hypothetical protein
MARALALESSAGEVAIENPPTHELGLQLLLADDFDQARRLLQAEDERALEHGDVDSRLRGHSGTAGQGDRACASAVPGSRL